MSREDALAVDRHAGLPARAAAAAAECQTMVSVRCTRRFARSAARTRKCPSCPEATDPCTVTTASAAGGIRAVPPGT